MAGTAHALATEVAPGVLRFRDTCNVYVLRADRGAATLIDFGSGAVLDRLAELGVEQVTDVLVTHHHRDQVQGLRRAADAGIRIWVPPLELDLVAGVDAHWQARQVDDYYDLRQDRFSLLEQVAVAGTVEEYRARRYGGVEAYALPTPGHTIGSVSYLVEAGGRRLAFTGDLLYGPGKVWSLAATQWTYTGAEGPMASFLSCGAVGRLDPDLLLPSHGEPIARPAEALALTRRRLQELAELRLDAPYDLEGWERAPWVEVTPHLLRNRTSFATSYALLSETGGALLLDWGYDQATGVDLPTDRAARRPLLSSLESLRRDHGVERVEAVVTTHYHDDHVAGLTLLRDVEGAAIWAPEDVAPILEDPHRYDLPCLWFEPIPVDRVLANGKAVRWHEYELTAHPLPGHTRFAAAIFFEVDGKRVLATGDQQAHDGGDRAILNYQYANRFGIDDFVASAELYRALEPELLVTGHWGVKEVTAGFLDGLLADGRRLAELHRELLPLDELDFGADGAGARIEPYRSSVAAGGAVELEVHVRNPFDREENATVRLAVPDGWAEPEPASVALPAGGEAVVAFVLTAGAPARRARVAADVTVGEARFGQLAEALVDVA
ncbi:MAG TPA: MBL fold metallo-hydrolase [Gaiellaceae bacterium]